MPARLPPSSPAASPNDPTPSFPPAPQLEGMLARRDATWRDLWAQGAIPPWLYSWVELAKGIAADAGTRGAGAWGCWLPAGRLVPPCTRAAR